MKKLMLIPVLLFTVCLIVVMQAGVTESAPSQQAPAEKPAQLPETQRQPEYILPEGAVRPAPGQADNKPLSQQTALPLVPEHERFYEELFLAVSDKESPNEELQEYVPDQTAIKGRKFTFTADRHDGAYISGKAESAFGFLYGSITFRVNSIDNPGLFPAVWMLPAHGDLLPEVDIYELIGREPETFYGVLHQPPDPLDPLASNREFFRHDFPQWAGIPDTYTLKFDWTPEALEWYLDGQLVYRITEKVPQIPMYLILNLAVGGTWCGDPTPETVFPEVFEVEILDFQPGEIFTR